MTEHNANGRDDERHDVGSGAQGEAGDLSSPNLADSIGEGVDPGGPDFLETTLADVALGDQWLDAIAQGAPGPSSDPEIDELARLLVRWRADILAVPMPQGPSLDEVEAAVLAVIEEDKPAVRRATRPAATVGGGGRRPRFLSSVASAAAAVAVVVGGVGVLAHGAGPGDPLWGVRQAIFGNSETVIPITAASIQSDLDEAARLLDTGEVANVVRAQEILAEVQTKIPMIEGTPQEDLTRQYEQLNTQLQNHPVVVAGEVTTNPLPTTPGGTTPPETTVPDPSGTPDPTDPTSTGTPGTTTGDDSSVPPTTTTDPTSGGETTDGTTPTSDPAVPPTSDPGDIPTSAGAPDTTTATVPTSAPTGVGGSTAAPAEPQGDGAASTHPQTNIEVVPLTSVSPLKATATVVRPEATATIS